jgi:DNA helicase-4
MGYADYLTIDYTYRNAQEVIDVAGAFVQENPTQLRKRLKSNKRIKKPFVLCEFNDQNLKDNKGNKGVVIEKAEKLDEVIGKIVQVEGENAEILLLVRYNFEINQLVRYSDLFYGNDKGDVKSRNYPRTRLTAMTVHKSKGLGFDNVIILNGSDEYFGFPSQIEVDPLLTMVQYNDKTYQYAEERRLFYVALTRTKNRVFILYPSSKPSIFIREMVENYQDVTLKGKIISKESNRKSTKCPVCGYPLQFKHNKAYGLKLYMCTNEVEVCGFMSNNLRGGSTSIEKCDKCVGGFLIVKPKYKEDIVFLGCTNYKSNGKGCNNSKSIEV